MSASLTSPAAVALDRLRYLVAGTATYQDVVAAGDAAEARESVYLAAADDEDETQQPPRAIISQSGKSLFMEMVSEVTNNYQIEGRACLTFEFRVPEDCGGSIEEQHNWFWDQCGNIIHEMMELSGAGESVSGETHLNMQSASLQQGPWREPQEEDEYGVIDESGQPLWWAEFEVGWRR